jgi:multidrug efflux system membrane fusion protein
MKDEAQLENAKVQLQRYQTLLGQDSIARQDVDTQAAMVKQLQAAIVTDRANENTARINLGWSRIVAPVAGRVGLRPIDVGNTISAGDANGVAVITQLTPIDVAFSVPQDRVPEVQASVAAGTKLAVAAFDRTRTEEARRRRLRDARQPRRRADRNRQGEGALRQRRRRAVPEPVRQRPPAAALGRRRDRRPVTAMRTGPNGDYVYVVNEDRTVSGAHGRARRRDQRGHRRHQGASRSASASSPRAATDCVTARASSSPGDAPQRGASGASGAYGGRRGASSAACGERCRRRTSSPPRLERRRLSSERR